MSKSFPPGTNIQKIFDYIVKPDYDKWLDEAFDYMEYIGLPDYVVHYEYEAVAKSFSGALAKLYIAGQSHRMSAIVLFGLTLEKIGKEESTKTIN